MRYFPLWLCFTSMAFLNSTLYGQMESFPCKNSNPELKLLFTGQTIKSLYVHNCYGPGLGDLSSSFLLPSGKPPAIIEYKYFLGIEILEVYRGSKYEDSCISEIVNDKAGVGR